MVMTWVGFQSGTRFGIQASIYYLRRPTRPARVPWCQASRLVSMKHEPRIPPNHKNEAIVPEAGLEQRGH